MTELKEIERLRTLIIEVADDLGLVEQAFAAVCQDATDENLDQRCALMELRTLIARLKGSGRPHKLNCGCPYPAEYAYCQDEVAPLLCENCGKTMAGHGPLANCHDPADLDWGQRG